MSDAPEHQGEIERWVIDACQQLKLQIRTADEDIFDAGATSLTIIRLIAKVETQFGAELISPDEIVEASLYMTSQPVSAATWQTPLRRQPTGSRTFVEPKCS